MTEGRKPPSITWTIEATTVEAWGFFSRLVDQHKDKGPDVLVVEAAPEVARQITVSMDGVPVEGEVGSLRLSFPVTFAPSNEAGVLRFMLAGKVAMIRGQVEDWPGLSSKLIARNEAKGFTIAKDAVPFQSNHFPVAAGVFSTPHHLAKRNPAGLPLYPDESEKLHELRTPLNVATGLALFYFTAPDDPGGWQEVPLKALTDQVFCLTERGAQRRGDHVPDVLAEVVKLFNETVAIATRKFSKHGRIWQSRVELTFKRVITELGLTYLDTKTGKTVRPDDPAFRKEAVALVVKGRRAYTPDGKDIKALTGPRWKLEKISWRWTPTIVDDLKAAPELDKQGRVMKDKSGKVLRGGYNIKVVVRIFNALVILRAENAFIAADLLVILATDIYRHNVVTREAEKLFDLLGLDDPDHPKRLEEKVKEAIFRLKQPDIAALLPGSDEVPRTDPNPDRRRAPYYRLIRSAHYTPPGILTREEVAKLELEAKNAQAEPPPRIASTPPGPQAEPPPAQAAFPFVEEAGPPLPSGDAIRRARVAAGINLRDFARMMKGPSFATWSLYERGENVRLGKIKPEVWDKVRAFIAQHGGGE